MYSVSSTATRVDWRVVVQTPRGEIDAEWTDLPLAYRLAAWPLAELPGAPDERGEERCLALLEGARAGAFPDATGVVIVRDRRTMHGSDADVSTERQRVVECEGAA